MKPDEERFRQIHSLALARIGQPGTYETAAAYAYRVQAEMESIAKGDHL